MPEERWFDDLVGGTGDAAGLPDDLRGVLADATRGTADEQAAVHDAARREALVGELETALAEVRGRDRLAGAGPVYRQHRSAIEYVVGLQAKYDYRNDNVSGVLDGYQRTITTPTANWGTDPLDDSPATKAGYISMSVTFPEVRIGDDLRRALERGGHPIPPVQPEFSAPIEYARQVSEVDDAIDAAFLVVRLALARGENVDVAYDLGAAEYRALRAETERIIDAIYAFIEVRDQPPPKRRRFGSSEPEVHWLLRAADAYRRTLAGDA